MQGNGAQRREVGQTWWRKRRWRTTLVMLVAVERKPMTAHGGFEGGSGWEARWQQLPSLLLPLYRGVASSLGFLQSAMFFPLYGNFVEALVVVVGEWLGRWSVTVECGVQPFFLFFSAFLFSSVLFFFFLCAGLGAIYRANGRGFTVEPMSGCRGSGSCEQWICLMWTVNSILLFTWIIFIWDRKSVV